jgi:multidrug efflux system membrane fusion protein
VHASDATGLVVITELSPISVVYPIPEDNVPRVMRRLGTGEAIVVDAWDRDQKVKLATGNVVTIDNQIDTTTGTVKLKAEFPNENFALFPNQFVNVRMLVQTQTDATLVPAAIRCGAPGTFVYASRTTNHHRDTRDARAGPGRGHAIASGSRWATCRRRRDRQTSRGCQGRIDHARSASRTAAGAKGRPPRGDRLPGSGQPPGSDNRRAQDNRPGQRRPKTAVDRGFATERSHR